MKQEIQQQPQQSINLVSPPIKKLNNKVIAVGIFIVVVTVVGYFALNRGETDISLFTTQPAGNQTQQQISNNDVSKKIVGPITIQSLMPVVEADQPSVLYQNSIIPVQLSKMSNEVQQQLNETIRKSDSEIKSRNVENSDYLFSILYTNSDKSFVLYMMTATGTHCIPPYEINSGCDNAKLKILNTKDNSVSLLTNNFVDGQGQIYLNKKDNSIIVFTDLNYEIFNSNKPYSLRKSTPTGFSSLLFNEYAISYNPITYNFVIENILSNKKIECTIVNAEIKNTLKNNFDFSHLSLSPNGNKIILFEGNNKFFWNDSSDCLNNAKEVELSNVKSVWRMGKWYANANYFGYSNHGDNAYIYNFDEQKQIFFMPWDKTIGVGYLNNFGYHDTASIDQKGSKVIVVPGEKQISIYFEMPDGKRYLVGNYADAGAPGTWVRIEKDNTDKNLYHVLVLVGYDIHQVLNVFVQP